MSVFNKNMRLTFCGKREMNATTTKKRKIIRLNEPLPHNFMVNDSGMFQKLVMQKGIHFRKRSVGGETLPGVFSERPAKPTIYPQSAASWKCGQTDFGLFNSTLHLQFLLCVTRTALNDCRLEVEPSDGDLVVTYGNFDPENHETPSDEVVASALSKAVELGVVVRPGTFNADSYILRVPPQVGLNSTTLAHFDTSAYKTNFKPIPRFLGGKGNFGLNSAVVEDGRAAALSILNFDTKIITNVDGGSEVVQFREPGAELLIPVQALIAVANTILPKPLSFKAGDLHQSLENFKRLSAAVKRLEVRSCPSQINMLLPIGTI